MNIPKDLKFTKDHEWARVEGDAATVGITDYAQHELGDIVFIELPKIGAAVEQSKPCANIEAVKAVSDLFAPVSGRVTEVNPELEGSPQLVNQDPYGKGWICVIQMSSPAEINTLLSAEDYGDLIG
jgi:glycine cleavage system H protein